MLGIEPSQGPSSAQAREPDGPVCAPCEVLGFCHYVTRRHPENVCLQRLPKSALEDWKARSSASGHKAIKRFDERFEESETANCRDLSSFEGTEKKVPKGQREQKQAQAPHSPNSLRAELSERNAGNLRLHLRSGESKKPYIQPQVRPANRKAGELGQLRLQECALLIWPKHPKGVCPAPDVALKLRGSEGHRKPQADGGTDETVPELFFNFSPRIHTKSQT
ncbi:unnamed protein product [Symbiodinium natans]|uniref:Uncharacterized protein n=1 Tax=Symbiodinium natans TaxID=878477 RepID=A0A812NPL8_9DINO|nr:unnamed protein product [Symbiodinium natans]